MKILVSPIVYFPLAIFENIVSRLFLLKIPIYSSLIYAWITNAKGLPHMRGMYLRALHYRRILKQMDPNVFIEQGVVFANLENVALHEFAYIDKRVVMLV